MTQIIPVELLDHPFGKPPNECQKVSLPDKAQSAFKITSKHNGKKFHKQKPATISCLLFQVGKVQPVTVPNLPQLRTQLTMLSHAWL